MAVFQCNKCSTTFTRKDALTRHIRKKHAPVPELDLNQQPGPSNANPVSNPHTSSSSTNLISNTNAAVSLAHTRVNKSAINCPTCGKDFKEHKTLQRHNRERHQKVKKANCGICGKPFARVNDMVKHMETHSKKRSMSDIGESTTPKKPKRRPRCTQTALQNSLQMLSLQPPSSNMDPTLFLKSQISKIAEAIDTALDEQSGVKVWMSLKIVFERSTDPLERIEAHFNACNRVILRGSNIPNEIAAAFPEILKNIEEFIQRGSGWVITHLEHLDIHIAKYQPLRGSSYIALPDHISKKKAVVNVQNEDNQCFKWSVLAALHPYLHNAQRLNHYVPFSNELNFTGITFPVKVSQVPQFERQNSLSINVYELENGDPCPLYISKTSNCPHIDLLLLTKGSKQHYCYIKNLDRLLFDQNKHEHKKHFCPRCLLPQYNAERKAIHLQLCQKNEPTKVEMPEDKWLHFKNLHRMQRVPYIMYADFECLTEKLPGCAPANAASFTERYQKHTPCGFGVVGVMNCCGEADIEPPTIYRGEDSVRKFLETILEQNEEYQANFSEAKPLDLCPEEQAQHDMTTECYLCNKSFQDGESGVRDHCHFCGKYRGAAHNRCNMGFRLSRDIVVAIHNLRRYDGHLIMQEIGLLCNEMGLHLDCIPKGMEDYLSFTLKKRKTPKRRQIPHQAANAFIDDEASDDDDDDEEDGEGKWKIRFVDSFQFLTSSLEGLVDNLAKEGLNKFPAMKQEFPNTEDLKKLVRKGVYPYDYMDSWARFSETKLPSKEDFWSQLNDSNISDADYQHAQEVWEQFNISSLGDYHDLYLKTDVLLLADVFESFRSFCLEHYSLDPAHYYTLPSFAWDACLKKTNVWLELLQEPDMYLFFEQGIRGGISVITHRYAKANNLLVPDFNPQDPLSWIMYLDANNLYGWTMVQKLPVRDFKWLSHEEIDEINWTYIPDGRMGYVLEVDLEYPEDLHESHNDYPLAPERVQVTPDMLSPYAQALCEDLGKTPSKIEKLVPNLHRKERYIVHYRNLSLYVRLGLRLTKVHRVLSFTQRAWMKPYIMFNTEMRKQAKCDFEKDLFKLLNNAVFGKTMENVRAYQSIQLVTEQRKFCKLVAKPRYNCSVIFSEDLVAVSMKRVSVQLCKPVYIGFCVLDLSKYLMYEFHYMYVVPKYGPKAKLLFTDTDSLCYHICTDNIYKDMQLEKFRFDTSDYPQNHFLYSTQNKKVLGKMKDETAGSPISEFCGLRAKMYSFVCNGIDKKRAKGIKKAVVKKCISHVDYVNTLRERTFMYHNMNLIRSNLHELYSIKLNKTSLSAYDDKRYLLDDGITSLAYGHYKI